MHNLNIELSTFRDEQKEMCVGAVFVDHSSTKPLPFPQGGAGIFLTSRAISKVSAMRITCIDLCKQWAGDVRMGCCLRLAAIPIVHSDNLWSRTPFLAVGADKRHHISAYPVSFHQMREPKWVHHVWSWIAPIASNIGSACASDPELRDRKMCSIWRRQQVLRCNNTAWRATLSGGVQDSATTGRRDGNASAEERSKDRKVAVPLSWDALAGFLRRDDSGYDSSLFLFEKDHVKIW
jgi:hypothetical protein